MKDKISIDRIQQLHPQVRTKFTQLIDETEAALGVTLRITQGLRTIAEQDALFAQGRTKPGNIVTNARGGSSFHNYGLAIDVVEIKNGAANWNFDFSKMKPIAQKLGIEWGGDFKTILDKPHFQISFGLKWQELERRYKAKDFIKEINFVRL